MQVDEEGRRSCAPSSSTPPAICTCTSLKASQYLECTSVCYGSMAVVTEDCSKPINS